MAFYSARFDTIDESQISDTVKNLYRNRDDDKDQLKFRRLFEPLFGSEDSKQALNMTRLMYLGYVDPVWNKMSEEERIENGLPTRFILFHKSPTFMLTTVIYLGKIMIFIKN